MNWDYHRFYHLSHMYSKYLNPRNLDHLSEARVRCPHRSSSHFQFLYCQEEYQRGLRCPPGLEYYQNYLIYSEINVEPFLATHFGAQCDFLNHFKADYYQNQCWKGYDVLCYPLWKWHFHLNHSHFLGMYHFDDNLEEYYNLPCLIHYY